MKKIENVIESCDDCRFAKEFHEAHQKSFMILRNSSRIKGYTGVDIPPNCPLESYGSDV
ncbi:hypothetical protein [Riemerella anatipestifer]|uniref:Uncharacterized protein n=1 Tax=Riemerella anatipestifer RA-CH-1 TaxID=1228997 RepID=J9R5X1_RIEAN|nr:hypothetical protein [Riemerella anatipestifer]AFR35873.1 hypothetical protein B739_1275 [Riemerella anatipestifer RA-CH-1]MCU7581616.1 hypothetical protein [Riemerella anatipestifer]MDR7832524.1 hypothetical protein [Riemerella anatipestifer]QYQ97481.1 hypothetical protein J6342_03900 [Riemerella anatipestifer]QZO84024.1 hypothetical protein K6T40_04220 [Riemerella anatipestifer]